MVVEVPSTAGRAWNEVRSVRKRRNSRSGWTPGSVRRNSLTASPPPKTTLVCPSGESCYSPAPTAAVTRSASIPSPGVPASAAEAPCLLPPSAMSRRVGPELGVPKSIDDGGHSAVQSEMGDGRPVGRRIGLVRTTASGMTYRSGSPSE